MNITLIFYIQIGFLLHFIGDYLTQTNWLATQKTKSFLPAFIHAFIYSIPFWFITNAELWLILFSTHYFIDRYRLAVYFIMFKNNYYNKANHGFPIETPVWLSTWLLFIIDNTFHIIINTTCITLSNWK